MTMGEVQTQAYANTAFLIASVTVHYADERVIKLKKCRRFAVVMPHEQQNTQAAAGTSLIICKGFQLQTRSAGKDWNSSISTFCLCQY